MKYQSSVLVEVYRNNLVESLHRGRLSIANPQGKELFKLGYSQEMTFMRSGAKPFQLLPLIEEGIAEIYNFTDKELAVMASSHDGEPIHLEAVRSILKKIGLDESYLKCGSHLPLSEKYSYELICKGIEPSPIHNNCSGKHAAMLAMAVAGRYSLDDYFLPQHPIQKLILKNLSELAELRQKDIAVATDGCGVPVFALPLYNIAVLYARLANPSDLEERRRTALKKISEAMRAHPEMVGGSEGNLCTDLMRAFSDKLVAKWGSEGFFGISILPLALKKYKSGVGIAIKIEDGNSDRALGPTVIEVLVQLGFINKELLKKYKHIHNPEILNHRKEVVGQVKACFSIGH
jgi:L-asparaginase II